MVAPISWGRSTLPVGSSSTPSFSACMKLSVPIHVGMQAMPSLFVISSTYPPPSLRNIRTIYWGSAFTLTLQPVEGSSKFNVDLLIAGRTTPTKNILVSRFLRRLPPSATHKSPACRQLTACRFRCKDQWRTFLSLLGQWKVSHLQTEGNSLEFLTQRNWFSNDSPSGISIGSDALNKTGCFLLGSTIL